VRPALAAVSAEPAPAEKGPPQEQPKETDGAPKRHLRLVR
jgi:hypothetical protein